MNDTIFLHLLNLFPKFGPKRLFLLANYFESFEAAFHATLPELIAAGIHEDIANAFTIFKQNIEPNLELDKLTACNIQLLDFRHPLYPELLQNSDTPPPLLYYKGTPPDKDAVMLAAVGTRKITTYGRSVIPNIIKPLAQAGIVIVSGMAYGIDAAVHTEVIQSQKPTIAVLGSGLDDKSLYPKEHALLAQEIIDSGGAIMSEYPPGTPGYKQNFIARNRIIAGLCVGTLIIECGLKSGSLITAQFALDQNRRVYAVPGPIYASESKGPNNLIKMGATLVTEATDILQDLNIEPDIHNNVEIMTDSPAQQMVLAILQGSPTAADELVKQSGLEAAVVSTALTFLEMKGLVKNVGANQYIRIR